MNIELNKVYNMDCLDLMCEMERQNIIADWIIADPPYGINFDNIYESRGGTKAKTEMTCKRFYKAKNWDKVRLSKKYFDLMFKVSKNQIIFGGNYYADILRPTKSWVIWNKRKPDVHNDYADCEMAWCSIGQARIFNYEYMGMIQGNMKNKDERFHPTQKPTQIICQLLNYYTKENDLIFDPFMGSFTTAIACHRLKRKFIGAELDKEYFDKGSKRLEQEMAQLSIFDL